MQHLKVLEESGLVTTRKEGRVRICHLDNAGLAAVEGWVQERRSLWERRFDRLGDILDEDG